jgi:hypothetical protein
VFARVLLFYAALVEFMTVRAAFTRRMILAQVVSETPDAWILRAAVFTGKHLPLRGAPCLGRCLPSAAKRQFKDFA